MLVLVLVFFVYYFIFIFICFLFVCFLCFLVGVFWACLVFLGGGGWGVGFPFFI